VELDVGVDVTLGRLDGVPHPVELEAHRSHVLWPGTLGGETGDLDLEDLTHLQKLPQGLRLDAQEQPERVAHGPLAAAANHSAAAVLDADEAACLEQVQGLPDDRPAHPEARTQLALGREPLPRLQPAGDHHLQQLVRHPVPEPGSSRLFHHT
jgi:hypothetical protein